MCSVRSRSGRSFTIEFSVLGVVSCYMVPRYIESLEYYTQHRHDSGITLNRLYTHKIYWRKLTTLWWASYQIRKIVVCACAGNAGNVFPATDFKETASKRSRYASQHVRDAHAEMHVGMANPQWRGERSRHSRRMRNPQFYISGKRSMASHTNCMWLCCALFCAGYIYFCVHLYC